MRKQLIVILIVLSLFLTFQNLSGAGFECVLMETGDYLLKEDGGYILLESATLSSPSGAGGLFDLGLGLGS